MHDGTAIVEWRRHGGRRPPPTANRSDSSAGRSASTCGRACLLACISGSALSPYCDKKHCCTLYLRCHCQADRISAGPHGRRTHARSVGRSVIIYGAAEPSTAKYMHRTSARPGRPEITNLKLYSDCARDSSVLCVRVRGHFSHVRWAAAAE